MSHHDQASALVFVCVRVRVCTCFLVGYLRTEVLHADTASSVPSELVAVVTTNRPQVADL